MYFQRLNRSSADKVFIRVKNAWTSASLTAGQVVCFAYSGTEDGVAVTKPVTAKLNLIAGVVKGTINIGDYGDVQAYGHNEDCLVVGTTDVAVGDKLAPTNAQWYVVKEGGTAIPGESGVIVAGKAYTSTTAAAKNVFIRCL